MKFVARADGPVPPSAVPGGVVVTDDDGGSGERWGRAGGRTLTFAAVAPSGFSALSWGAVFGTSPGVAFDGAVSGGSSERLSYDAGQSALASGVAHWTGSAVLSLATTSASYTIPTRMTLTVTNSGGPVPLAFVSGAASPGLDVLASGPFTVNLRFEGDFGSAGGPSGYSPLLDTYDALPTIPGSPPGSGGPVITEFNHGFYFALAGGLTLAEHDANMNARLDAIKGDTSAIRGDTAFLRIDTVGRLAGLASELQGLRSDGTGHFAALSNDLLNVASLVQQLPGQILIPPLPGNLATSDDVRSASRELSNILLILFGIEPCPVEAGPLCTTATFVKDLATRASIDEVKAQIAAVGARLGELASQASVDGVAGQVVSVDAKLDGVRAELGSLRDAGQLEIQAFAEGSDKRQRFLLKTTHQGRLVPAELTRLLVVKANKKDPSVVQDVTGHAAVQELLPGLLELTLDPPAPSAKALAYQFEMQYRVDNLTTVEGSVIVAGERLDR